VNAAIEWLQAHFEQTIRRFAGAFRYASAYQQWRGPSDIRPMIEFLPLTDAGKPMRVMPHDYDDPERRWL
jgi:hypothetical protein